MAVIFPIFFQKLAVSLLIFAVNFLVALHPSHSVCSFWCGWHCRFLLQSFTFQTLLQKKKKRCWWEMCIQHQNQSGHSCPIGDFRIGVSDITQC